MSDSNSLQHLEAALEIVLQSESLADLCRRAVLSPSMGNLFQGCHIWLIDQEGKLAPETKFGADLPADHQELANRALFTQDLLFKPQDSTQPGLAALALMNSNMPAGVALLVLTPGTEPIKLSREIVPMVSKLLGIHLNTKSKDKSIQTFSGKSSVEEMSTRQVKILEFMAEGLTNAEIARRLLLSESTVRQESVRIYRTFNTDNRQMAVAMGREAGLIPKLPLAG